MSIAVASGSPQFSGSLITPMYIHDRFVERLYDRLIFPEFCNMEYERDFKNGADTITIYREQQGNSRVYRKGQKLEHDYLDAEPITLPIDRARYYDLALEGLDKIQIPNVDKRVQSYIKNSVLRSKQEIEKEILAYAPTEVSALNQGANAGEASGSINLGTAAAAGHRAITPANSVEWLTDQSTVLEEAGVDLEDSEPWIVLPSVGRRVLRYSNKITNRDFNGSYGDGMTPTLSGRIPTKIEGYKVLISNRVPFTVNAANEKVYQIVSGTRSALAFYMQADKTRGPIHHPDFNIELMQGFMSYGFKAIQPEQMTLSYATFAA